MLSSSVFGLLALAFVLANLPFVNHKLLACVPMSRPKTLLWRLAELIVAYFLVGGLGLALEQRAGQIAPQGWEFYAITATLFLTFAFPGFVYRYLLRHER